MLNKKEANKEKSLRALLLLLPKNKLQKIIRHNVRAQFEFVEHIENCLPSKIRVFWWFAFVFCLCLAKSDLAVAAFVILLRLVQMTFRNV